jgi:polysaccharide biosynthesis/export protein
VRFGSFAVIVSTAFMLQACARDTWDESRPGASAGGTGVLTDGTLAERPEITGATDETPAFTQHGIRAPYGSAGEDAAYEFGRGYKIGSGDRLSIRVIGEPELTNEYAVDGSGNISFPYLKSVEAGGRTAPEVQAMIAHRLKQGLLRNPHVSVQVASLRPFYILGEVTTAGSFPYQEGMTVQNAIAIAGGYSARADQTDVMVSRKTAKGTNTYQVPVTTQLYPGDVVYVRERWF